LAPRSREFAAGACNLLEKGAELPRVFLARAGLDAAGYVDRIGADNPDGFTNIFGCKSTGEDDPLRLGSGPGSVPVAGNACAAIVAGHCGIQEKGTGCSISEELGSSASLRNAEGFDNGQVAGKALYDLGRLIAVELRSGKSERLREREDRFRGPVYEHADRRHEGRKAPDQFRSGGRRKATRTFGIKIQADGMRTKFGSEFCVFELGDTTDFHSDHGGLCLGSRRHEKSPQDRGRIRSRHELFTDEEGIETGGTKLRQIGVSSESRFSDGKAAVRDLLDEFERGFHAHGESFQVAIVDADDSSICGQGAVELLVSVNFDEGLHAEFTAKSNEIAQRQIVEGSYNQEKAVGVVGPCFPDLPGIKDEILAKSG